MNSQLAPKKAMMGLEEDPGDLASFCGPVNSQGRAIKLLLWPITQPHPDVSPNPPEIAEVPYDQSL